MLPMPPMRPAPLRVAFAAASAVTAVTGALERRAPLAAAKGSLVPLLAAEVAARRPAPRDRGLLLTALGGAWVGDVALLPPAGGDAAHAVDPTAVRRQLRRGAAAFAVQQAAYLALLARRGHRPRARVAAPVAAWLGVLAVLDAREQHGGRPDPVVTGYGVLLGAMAATAMSSGEARLVRGGAAFLASDSAILLRERFLHGPRARAVAEAFVLASYTDAQRYLVDALTDR